MTTGARFALVGLLLAAPLAVAENPLPQDELRLALPLAACYEMPEPAKPDPMLQRFLTYSKLAVKHRLSGLASYYSGFFDGRKTARSDLPSPSKSPTSGLSSAMPKAVIEVAPVVP